MSAGRSAAATTVAGKAEPATESTDNFVFVFDETVASFAAPRFAVDPTTAAAAAPSSALASAAAATSALASAAAATSVLAEAAATLGGSAQFLGAFAGEDREFRGGETGGVTEAVASRDSDAGGCGDGDVFFPPFFERCLWWPCPELALFLEEEEERVFPPAASPLERSSTDRNLSNAAAHAVTRSVRIRLAELVA